MIKLLRITLGILIMPCYFLITYIRNKFFDKGIISSKTFNIPIICIGNLSMGGTGKTPLTEYLIRLLLDEHKIAVISRGYGRKTSHTFIAQHTDTATTIGDEPAQYMEKFCAVDNFSLVLANKRAEGIELLIERGNKEGDRNLSTISEEVILLDDAYQHRYVKTGLNILLSDYNKPFFSDYLFPCGDLRESRTGGKRAEILVFTKCSPKLRELDAKHYIQKSRKYIRANTDIFFTSINYAKFVICFNKNIDISSIGSTKNIILLTSIANAKPLLNYLKDENYKVLKHIEFADHYSYTQADILKIKSIYDKYAYNLDEKPILLTTQKDYMRLKGMSELLEKSFLNLAYVPIKVNILFDRKEEFNNCIKKYLEHHKSPIER